MREKKMLEIAPYESGAGVVENHEESIISNAVQEPLRSINEEEALIAEYREELVDNLSRLIRSRSRAEDLAHDAIITTIKKVRGTGLDSPQSLPGYLQKTAYYIYLGSFRRLGNQVELVDSFDHVESESLSPECDLSLCEFARAVRKLIDELPCERDQQILRRRYLQDEPKHSICEVLELSPDRFDTVIGRARMRLKKIALRHEMTPHDY
jgi:RNA polymerase sigma factor (sigma-70 family)